MCYIITRRGCEHIGDPRDSCDVEILCSYSKLLEEHDPGGDYTDENLVSSIIEKKGESKARIFHSREELLASLSKEEREVLK